MFKAKPNINNSIGAKTFSTQEEAVNYLNEKTGFAMQALDWKIINKLIMV